MNITAFLNLIKTHGLSVALMLGGLYYLDSKLVNAEARILALEHKLYECYEGLRPAGKTPDETRDNAPVVFIKPKEETLRAEWS
jgi:hypothetical protein